MKAVFLTDTNQPLIIKEVEMPEPKAHQVLIKLAYSALNHRDVWIQKGKYAGPKSGLILGSDGLGTVTKVGERVEGNWLGKKVIINPSHDWGDDPAAFGNDFKILGNPEPGTFSEYIAVDEKYVHLKPAHLTDEEAAALPLAGITTYRALFTRAAVKRGEKVLVTGIGAGTALLALQYAIAAGAQVYVTSSSSEKIDRAKALGAVAGYNYKEEDWFHTAKNETGGFDVIVDSASGKGFGSLIEAARPGGRIVFFGGTDGVIGNIVPNKIFWRNLSILGTTMGTLQDFKDMLEYTEKHHIKPILDKVYPHLAHAQDAVDYMHEGKQFGKIVLTNV
ncbi:quinone oxidoreductase family protein [Dyadobacter aurulentus]|uniref:quinone oxidoreductase family protein n=1 Tax=Dyadobacter sp. UC 10 TaxID=2605428 RepID=UPI0011F313ED|nr:zinc-binding dehydrogenase [Dyadobacter sp. UC 10]KAA0993813.1 zinc-binding dehydrogenase [Dyadobacter sp. UC 10]